MPRSPSRDLSDLHDGSRGYFRQPGWVTKAKLALAGLGLSLTLAWAVVDVQSPSGVGTSHSPGKLASPHSAWESNCVVCHVGFSAKNLGVASLFTAGDRWQTLTCEKCHSGPAHHDAVDREGQAFHARCANCHGEHQGTSARLTKVTDNQCVRCHGNLSAHHAGESGSVSTRVTSFAVDHPEFKALAGGKSLDEPSARTLKFSHGLHMTPGLTYRPEATGQWTIGRLVQQSGKDAGKRYFRPGQSEDSPVTLECASCHSTESTGNGSRLSPRTDGAYYQPVRFEAHCIACHPTRAPDGVVGTTVVPGFDVRHGTLPEELAREISGGYSRRIVDANNQLASTPLGPVGRFDPRSHPELVTYKAEVDRLTAMAMRNFSARQSAHTGTTPPVAGGSSCSKCHDLVASREVKKQPTVAPVSTPTIWFPGAKFDHASHRDLQCSSCHAGTEGSFFGTGWVSEKEPVRIAGVDNCKLCHGPKKWLAGADGTPRESGGSKHACTDCHQYHNGDHPLQGRGSNARNPDRPLKPTEFFGHP